MSDETDHIPSAGSGPAPLPHTATLADVARAANVGESTASRVLRNQGSFSEATRKMVENAAARLGYVPNRVAGTLASTGSNLVGIIIPSLGNIVFPDLLRGANGVLEAAGFQSVIGVTEYSPAREEALIASLLSWRPAGLLIVGLEHTSRASALLRGSGVKVIELFDTDGSCIDYMVGFSNHAAGKAAATHLASRGYQEIGFVGHDLTLDLRAGKRFAGFVAGLHEAGLTLAAQEIVPSPSSIKAGREGLEALLARAPQLDAVYFSNDDMALGGYFLCLSRGIPIPGQLALMGHNGLDVGQSTPQPLSSIRTPRIAIGEAAARLITQGDAPRIHDLGFELMTGGTT